MLPCPMSLPFRAHLYGALCISVLCSGAPGVAVLGRWGGNLGERGIAGWLLTSPATLDAAPDKDTGWCMLSVHGRRLT